MGRIATMRAVRRIGDAVSRNRPPRTSPYDASATVTAVDGGTAWVQVDGAAEPMPVAMTIDCKPGDRVRVRVSSAGAHVSGNATAPPTDDAEALAAKVRAQLAQETAETAQALAESAQETADEAQAVSEATNQHFWHRSTDPGSDGAGTGAFVTDEEQEDFLDAIASGTAPTTSRPLHNLLMNAEGILLRAATRIRAAFTPDGVAFYDGQGNAASNVNAAFGSDGFQVGRTDESHLVGDYHSLKLMNKEGNAYFFVSDLRNEDGVVAVEQTFTGDGVTRMFWLWAEANSNDYTVDVSDGSGGSVSKFSSDISFSSAPSAGAVITVDYETEDPDSIAFTFGTRMTGEDVGLGSVGMGDGVCASGRFSHAEGTGTRATDSWTHAEGYGSVANAQASHAEGDQTEASGKGSHAEGEDTLATSLAAHAEGGDTHATGVHSHAEGAGSVASGAQSHAQNYQTISARRCQTALGTYNVEDTASATTHPGGWQDCGKYAVIIGNGTALARSNALAVGWDGSVDENGILKLHTGKIDRDGAAPSSTVWSDAYLAFYDGGGDIIGYVRPYETAAGNMWVAIQAFNEPAGGGTQRSNALHVGVDKAGNALYSFSDPAAFRSALGLDAWENVALSDFATAASGWSFVSGGCVIQRNEALGAVRCRLQLTPSANQTAGQKTVATVKAAYRPKTVHGSLSSLTSNAQAAQIYTSGGMAVNILAISSGVNLYFNGTYFIGS